MNISAKEWKAIENELKGCDETNHYVIGGSFNSDEPDTQIKVYMYAKRVKRGEE